MFTQLKQARPLLMGLAIVSVAVYHAPFILTDPWVKVLHDSLYSGVDVFLLLSGIGAVHSLSAGGGRRYLRKRALRLLPGLLPVLLVWSLLMLLFFSWSLWDFLGSVTLLGWWLGNDRQLNWYFSAVWLFFLLAVPVAALLKKSRHPLLHWLWLTGAAVVLGVLCPFQHLLTALTRLPVFFTGMLLGELDRRGFSHTGLLRLLLLLPVLPGIYLILMTFWGPLYDYGYSLGLWWYFFALTTPGLCVAISALGDLLKRFRPAALLLRPLEICGESSAEILAIHVGLFKILSLMGIWGNRRWLLALLLGLLAGCLYRHLAAKPLSALGERLFGVRSEE